MTYHILFTNDALNEIQRHKKSGQKVLLKELERLIIEIKANPKTGTGKPEQLKWISADEIWSRRIDKKHRLTYKINPEERSIEILSVYCLLYTSPSPRD